MEGTKISEEINPYVWFILPVISLFLALYLGKLYYKDRDQKKLIFILSFASISFSYFYLVFEGMSINTGSIGLRFFDWTSVPIIIAVFIAANDFIFKPKKYDNIVKIFIIITVATFIIPFFQLNTLTISNYIRMVVAIEIHIAAIYGFYKTRNISFILFLIAMFSLSIGGMAFVANETYIGIFGNSIGLILLSLIFFIPDSEKFGVSSYFTLKERLLKTEALLKTAIDQSPAGIIIADAPDVKIRVANNEALNIRGKDQKSLTNISVDEHVKQWQTFYLDGSPYDPKDLPLSRAILNGENVRDEEVIIKDITGDPRYVIANASPIKNEKGNVIAGMVIFYDITNKKKSEEELKKAHQELKILNKNLEEIVEQRTKKINLLLKQKDEFINQLGHDLKNPLGPMINLIPIVKKHTTNEKDKHILEVVQRNIGYMKNLVEKTLELARLNSPNTDLNKTRFPLKEIADQVITQNHYSIELNHIEISNRISTQFLIDADKLLIEELFNNLLNNSIKYCNDHGKIILDADENEKEILISIQDNGLGMTHEQQDQIFDEFYKADESRHDFDSTGLGMTISKRIVEKHGGKIWVESPGLDQGSTFYFTLPKKLLDHQINPDLINTNQDISERVDLIIEKIS